MYSQMVETIIVDKIVGGDGVIGNGVHPTKS